MAEEAQIPHDLVGLALPRLRLNDHTLDEKLSLSPAGVEDGGRRRSPSVANLGSLEVLPLELLHITLSQLDIRTLADFQCVNRRAAELVHSIPKYNTIKRYFPTALVAIQAIRTGMWITCETLYTKLCTAECEECGDFGGHLYLFTCKRVCFICFTHKTAYMPLSSRYASRKFGLEGKVVDLLPQMRVLPGVYSPNAKKTAATVLVDYEACLAAGIEQHGTLEAMERCVSEREARKVEAYNSRLAKLPQPAPRTRQPRLRDPPPMHIRATHSGSSLLFERPGSTRMCEKWNGECTAPVAVSSAHLFIGEDSSRLPHFDDT